jgi:hypothetical protein
MSSESDRGFFHYHHVSFSPILKSRVGNILAKASALRINLNTDGSPIVSKSHTHPSHSQTSRFLLIYSNITCAHPMSFSIQENQFELYDLVDRFCIDFLVNIRKMYAFYSEDDDYQLFV